MPSLTCFVLSGSMFTSFSEDPSFSFNDVLLRKEGGVTLHSRGKQNLRPIC